MSVACRDMTDHRHHTFDYVELAAPDISAAKAFYAEEIGRAHV